MEKDYLILKRASAKPRPSGEWNDDDYDVLADGAVVGPDRHGATPRFVTKRPRKNTAAKLRSWRVSIIRKRGQYLGTVASGGTPRLSSALPII
jgi:hypothetical protein